MLKSNVHITSSDAIQEGSGNNIVDSFVLGLFFTIVIYTIPLMIYRFVIRKTPVSPSKAKKISIIYSICAFIVITFILYAIYDETTPGGSISTIWTFIDYYILKKGYNNSVHENDKSIYIGKRKNIDKIPNIIKELLNKWGYTAYLDQIIYNISSTIGNYNLKNSDENNLYRIALQVIKDITFNMLALQTYNRYEDQDNLKNIYKSAVENLVNNGYISVNDGEEELNDLQTLDF